MADSAAQPDNWSAEAYQNAAAFVPKLTTKVVEWLDVQPGDRILDIGCGGTHFSLFPLSLSHSHSPTSPHSVPCHEQNPRYPH